MKSRELLAALIGILILSTAVLGADHRVSFSLRGGYYLPISSTYNDEYRAAVNANLSDLNSYLTELGLSGSLTELPKFKGTFIFGGEFELYGGQQFTLALGTEFLTKSFKSQLKASGDVDEVAWSVEQNGKARVSVLPILGTIRINLPVEVVRVYIGGGAGYYLGRVVIREDWTWTEEGIQAYSGNREIKATGKSFIPHANAGVDVAVSSHVFLTADLRYPFGKIKSFKIKSDSQDEAAAGQKLTFLDAGGTEKDFSWEMTGPSFQVSFKIKF